MRQTFVASILLAIMLASCSNYKQISYLQEVESLPIDGAVDATMYDARIQPKDELTIVVSTTDPKAATPFNLTTPTALSSQSTAFTSQPALQKYLVDNEGYIDFPVLGRLQVGNLTKTEIESLIKEQLKPYLHETPIVNVRMTNYKISVLGEVKAPGTFIVDSEKVSILEALAMAGDMTIYGQRNNVKLVREDASGKREVVEMNLLDASIIHSPYYYLQQNDVVYITPNKVMANNSKIGSSTTIWFSVISTTISVLTLILTIAL